MTEENTWNVSSSGGNITKCTSIEGPLYELEKSFTALVMISAASCLLNFNTPHPMAGKAIEVQLSCFALRKHSEITSPRI